MEPRPDPIDEEIELVEPFPEVYAAYRARDEDGAAYHETLQEAELSAEAYEGALQRLEAKLQAHAVWWVQRLLDDAESLVEQGALGGGAVPTAGLLEGADRAVRFGVPPRNHADWDRAPEAQARARAQLPLLALPGVAEALAACAPADTGEVLASHRQRARAWAAQARAAIAQEPGVVWEIERALGVVLAVHGLPEGNPAVALVEDRLTTPSSRHSTLSEQVAAVVAVPLALVGTSPGMAVLYERLGLERCCELVPLADPAVLRSGERGALVRTMVVASRLGPGSRWIAEEVVAVTEDIDAACLLAGALEGPAQELLEAHLVEARPTAQGGWWGRLVDLLRGSA